MRLGTHAGVVRALEQGRFQDLPPWPETARVISAYTGLAHIDPMPILQCMARCYEAAARTRVRQKPRRSPVRSTRRLASAVLGRGRAMLGGTTAAFADVGRGISGHPWLRLLLALGFSAAFMLIVTQTALLEASVSKLPRPLAQMVRSTQDYVLHQFAPVREGLRWIEVDDPRSRRGDKLQTGRR